jgi:hypothetical protein
MWTAVVRHAGFKALFMGVELAIMLPAMMWLEMPICVT